MTCHLSALPDAADLVRERSARRGETPPPAPTASDPDAVFAAAVNAAVGERLALLELRARNSGMPVSPDQLAAAEADVRRAAAEERVEIQRLPCCGLPADDGIAACEAASTWATCRYPIARRGYGQGTALLACDCPRDRAVHRSWRWRSNVRGSGIPQHFHAALLASPRWRAIDDSDRFDPAPRTPLIETDALRVARAFAGRRPATVITAGGEYAFRGDEKALVLAGNVGVGKSFAAAFVLASLGGSWVRALDVCRFNPDEDPVSDAEEARGVLVLDDLGREHIGATEYALSVVDRLVGARCDADAMLVITCNLNEQDFGARYGARVADRLRGMGTYVELPGTSLRGSS